MKKYKKIIIKNKNEERIKINDESSLHECK